MQLKRRDHWSSLPGWRETAWWWKTGAEGCGSEKATLLARTSSLQPASNYSPAFPLPCRFTRKIQKRGDLLVCTEAEPERARSSIPPLPLFLPSPPLPLPLSRETFIYLAIDPLRDRILSLQSPFSLVTYSAIEIHSRRPLTLVRHNSKPLNSGQMLCDFAIVPILRRESRNFIGKTIDSEYTRCISNANSCHRFVESAARVSREFFI